MFPTEWGASPPCPAERRCWHGCCTGLPPGGGPAARQALAAQYVAEALGEEPELTVRAVELVQTGETGLLTVQLDWQGQELTAQLSVR